MIKKAFFLAIIPIFIGGYGASLFQKTFNNAGATVMLKAEYQPSLIVSDRIRYESVSGKVEQEDLEKQMQEVFEELRKLEDMFMEKMNRDVLPRIQEEIKRLKEWLEKHERKKSEPPPQWTKLGPTPQRKAYPS